MLDINSYFRENEFNGTITVAFRSLDTNSDLEFELVNASVAIDNVVNAVSELSSVTLKAVPSVYSLAQNFPNPFNPTTTIEYSIPQSGQVELAIWNIAGQKVRTLVSENQTASYKRVVWDGRNDMGETVGAGLYIYKLTAGNFTKIHKMNLIK
jgi:flagellar hook assembly protein FlgD